MPTSVKIKMCGFTHPDDAKTAADLGVDAVGMVLSEGDAKKSFERYISKPQAMDIVEVLPDEVKRIGVFVDDDHDRINSLVEILQLDFVQFYNPHYHIRNHQHFLELN